MSSETESSSAFPLGQMLQLEAAAAEVRAALLNQDELLRLRQMRVSPDLLANLETIAQTFSALSRSFVTAESELDQLRRLAATAALLNSNRDLDAVLAQALGELIDLTRAERVYLVLVNPADHELTTCIAREGAAPGAEFRGSHAILADVLASGEPLLTDNAYKDPRFQDRVTMAAPANAMRSVMCAPLVYKGQTTGAVYADNRMAAGVFDRKALALLVAFASQVAVAIENARLFTQAQAYLREITELNAVRENVFGSVGSGIITVDADNIVQSINPAAEAILGVPAAAAQRLLPALLPVVHTEQLDAVRQGQGRQSFEAEAELAEGLRRVLSIKLSPLQDVRGQTQGVVVVVDDLTEQRAREEDVHLLQRYLPPAMLDNIEHIAGLALGGERRELTCMYVDVRPLASFPVHLQPREVMALLNEYHSVATECLNAADGVIDKYMGTEIMALWNTQLNPMADHAQKALEAAGLMRDAFASLYEWQGDRPAQPYFRIGIHSGVATTGNVGSLSRRDFTALGDTINLAHRLLENAAPGQILVSEQFRAAVGAAQGVLLRECGTIQAKGRQQKTVVYEAVT